MWVEQLVEGFGQLDTDDIAIVDLEPFEEGLVEQPTLLRRAADVGGLDAVGEGEGGIEDGEKPLVVSLQALDRRFSGDAFASQARLLLGEELFGDLVLVVRVEQLAFLAFGALQRRLRRRDVGRAGIRADLAELGSGDRLAALRRQHHLGVLVLDARLDGLDAVVRLGADAALPAARTRTGRTAPDAELGRPPAPRRLGLLLLVIVVTSLHG